MDATATIQERILAAADALYQQAGLAAFPTVDAVRKSARVNMNDASAGMKLWRRGHTMVAVPVTAPIPAPLQQATSHALAVLWHEAQQAADERFHTVRSAWDTERAEADTAHRQLADAYESLAAELDTSQADAQRKAIDIASLTVERSETATKLAQVDQELMSSRTAEKISAVLIEEMGRRIADLSTELGHAHRAGEDARTAMERAGNMHMQAEKEWKTETTQVLLTAYRVRDEALRDADSSREIAATLRGRLDATEQQNVALLSTVATFRKAKPAG